MKNNKVSAKSLYNIQLTTGARISPDGKNVVFTVYRIDKKTQKKYANLWVASSITEKIKQFTE